MPFSLGSRIALKGSSLRRRAYGFTTYRPHSMPCEGGDCDVPSGTDDGFLGPLVWWAIGSGSPPEDLINHSILPDENTIDTYFIPNGGIQVYDESGYCREPYCVQFQGSRTNALQCCSDQCKQQYDNGFQSLDGGGPEGDDADPPESCPAGCDDSDTRRLKCREENGVAGWGIPFSVRISFENYERNNGVLKYLTKQFRIGDMETELYDGENLLAKITVTPPTNGSLNLRKVEKCLRAWYPCSTCPDCVDIFQGGQQDSTITYESYDANVIIEVDSYNIGEYWENFRSYLWANSGIGWDSLTGDAWREYTRVSAQGIPDYEDCTVDPGQTDEGRNRMLAVVINPELASPLPGDGDGPPAGGPDPADGWVAARLLGACNNFRNLTIDFSEQYELTGVTHPWVAGYSADRFSVIYTGSSPEDDDCSFPLNPAAFRTEFLVNVNQGDEPGIPDDDTLPDALEALYNQYDYLKVSFYDAEYTESQPGGSPLGGYYQFGISGGSADITVTNVSTNRTSKWEWYDENGASYDAEAIPNLQSGLTGPLPSFENVWGPILAYPDGYAGSYVWAQITGGTYATD